LLNEISKGVKEEIKRMINWIAEQELEDQQIKEVVKEILNTQDEKEKILRKFSLLFKKIAWQFHAFYF
jgi:Asp-tRNA(Asn)/Glu-tRNA(Gln) amidotransferase B subunit